jgi:hypothetical protein
MSTGSVLIYFKEEQINDERPLPSIRARLDVLENSGSTWLNATLQNSIIDDSDDGWALPSMPEGSMSPQNYSQYHDQSRRRMLRPTSPGGRSPPPFDIDQSYDGISTRATSRLDNFSEAGRSQRSNSNAPFPQISEDNPTHKIWFTAPEHIKTAQGQRMHHVAIRNFLAMLHGKPIVGADLFDMLSTLQPQIEDMYRFDDNQGRTTSHDRSIQMITNYLGQNGIDDVRNSVKSAMCLLAWSEQEHVKWRQGYLETFVHLAGVMIPELEDVPEFKRLSIVTRRNLGIAAKTLQLRKMEAEEKLAAFDFGELWEDASKMAISPVYHSYQAFRSFLVNHYSRNYGNWPPVSDKTWLNRKIALALQDDFGSLYDYLVNRDVVWNPREERASRKWEMAHRKDTSFKADVPELGITDMLVRFDAKFSYAHIPHPYPLLPRDIPKANKEKEKKSLFSSLKKDKSKDVTKDAKAHLQLSILFSDATNIEKLDVNFHGKFSMCHIPTTANTPSRIHPHRQIRAIRNDHRPQVHHTPRSPPGPLDPPLRHPASPLHHIRRRPRPQTHRQRPPPPLHRPQALSRMGHKRANRIPLSLPGAILVLATKLGPSARANRARRTRRHAHPLHMQYLIRPRYQTPRRTKSTNSPTPHRKTTQPTTPLFRHRRPDSNTKRHNPHQRENQRNGPLPPSPSPPNLLLPNTPRK